jgi:hypothetical protein
MANDGGIWSSTDNGATAAARNTGLTTLQFYSLAGDNSHRNRLIGGTQDNGTVRRPDAGGTTWNNVQCCDGITVGVDRDAPSVAYSTIQNGYIFRTMNENSTAPNWIGVTPPYSSGEQLYLDFYTPLALDPVTPSTIYTASYRVWKSTNGGNSWTALASLPGANAQIELIAIAPSNPAILVVSSGLGIFRTTNGGSTWTRIDTGAFDSPLNCLAIDRANPSIIYIGQPYSPGGIQLYWTTNAGGTWAARNAGLPNFSVQAIYGDPGDPNTLFCGTDVGLYKSTNQGLSWANVIGTLNNSSIQAIDILDDRTIIRIGTHGLGAYESTYIASANLSPVASINGASSLTLARGTVLTLTGTTSDPDVGDTVSGVWVFPDSWQRVTVAGGATSMQHTFASPGTFPVTLTAKDSHNARSSAVVTVTVQ